MAIHFRLLGHRTVARMQQNWAARVYYNTHVRVGKRLIKVILQENVLSYKFGETLFYFVFKQLTKFVVKLLSFVEFSTA